MVSERAREQITFARSLETALTAMGHRVHRGPEPPASDLRTDLVIGGVASALSPGATYALVGLVSIGQALVSGTPLLLFVDDPNLSKIRGAAQSALREPSRLYTPYLMSKRVKQSRHLSDLQRTFIESALAMIAEETWPPTLLPLHPWASPAIAAKRLGITSEVLPVDVSSVVEIPDPSWPVPARAQVWLTDRHYSSALLDPARVRWPVIPVDSTMMPDPVRVYAVARGVHQGVIDRVPGWWTPTPLFVARADTVYLCDSEESTAIGTGTPYYLTPDDVESRSVPQHTMLAEHQREHLKETMWNSEMLSSSLTDSIGRVCSSGTPGTTTSRATSATS
jgi:hypothetical protein